jgi:hypothetical protein
VTGAAKLDRVLHAMGSGFGDLDNDGWLDFYLGTGDPDLLTLIPNRMFRNAGGTHFQDVTTSGGFGHLQKGHGVSFADLDNDGDQDVHEDLGGAVTGDVYPNVLFENPGMGQPVAQAAVGRGEGEPFGHRRAGAGALCGGGQRADGAPDRWAWGQFCGQSVASGDRVGPG